MSELAHATSERPFGAGGPTLAEVGERELLERLVAIAARRETGAAGSSGDDAAVWSPPAGRDLATTIDAMVEGVDFRRSWITPRRLGRRAFAVAVSDLAGMGAVPGHCVATLCAPPSEQLEDVLEIQRGLCEGAAEAGCAVVGGDTSAIDGPLVIDVCVTGSLPAGRALRRGAGRPGDAVLVTGSLGRAAAGLRLLSDGTAAGSPAARAWIEAQLQPVPRLREGRRLVEAGVLCGGDVSDGVAVDAARTARACGCAVEIWADSLPVDPELREHFGRDWLQLALGGGEDFELLITCPASRLDALLSGWPADLAPLTVIGALGAGDGVRLLDRRGGAELSVPPASSAHFG